MMINHKYKQSLMLAEKIVASKSKFPIYQYPSHYYHSSWVWLIILGLLCTSLAFALAIHSLKELSAFISNLSINLEPVYGILLAIWLLNEDTILNFNFYLGTSIILLAVVLHPILTKYKNKKNAKH